MVIGDTAGGFGYLSDGEKWYVVQHAQALLYVSLYEGFGFPPLEAWQAGVPVIASAAGAIPEICGPAALYVNPYSSSDVTTAVQTSFPIKRCVSNSSPPVEPAETISMGTDRRHTLQVLHQAVY